MKRYLAVFIFLTCLINPFLVTGQSPAYQLSPKADSLVQFLIQESSNQDQARAMEIIESHKLLEKISLLKKQLERVRGDERLEMGLNLQLGLESKWVENSIDSYQYYTRALYLAEKLDDQKIIAIASFEIGDNIRFGYLGREFESYFRRATSIFENLSDPLSRAYLIYAKLLLDPNNQQNKKYVEEAIAFLKSDFDPSNKQMMEFLARYLNIAGFYSQDQKLKFWTEGLSVARASENYIMQGQILNNIGYDFILKGQFDEALPYHLEALDISLMKGLKGLASNGFNNLSRCYLGKGLDREALGHFRASSSIIFNLNNDKFLGNIAEMEVEHETDRVELQNDLLLSEQKLQGRQLLILIVISVLLLVIAGFVYWSRRRVAKTNEKLKALDKTKSRFFANISHELRTPLTLINAPLEALVHSGKINDPEVRETIETATRNGEGLLSLVEEILDLAKLEGGRLTLVENPVRVNDFLKLVLSDYKSGLDHKSIQLNYQYLIEEDLAVLIDENRCTKIINNLLSNALKFTPEGGNISVVVSKNATGKRIQITVSDTGIGIHPSDLPHVFDRYFQSDQPGKKAEGGTGIGLALAKELAELHGGSLSVTSELEVGASFIFELPIRQVLEEAIVPISRIEDRNLSNALSETVERYTNKFEIDKPVLLITEDHPEMRAFIAQTLAPYFDIRQAENGKVALEVLNSERIDIVISDVMMPVMDGFELLEAIKKDEALHQVSLIMLTARADHDDKLYALTLGIDDYLTKPFNASEFLARIKNILENRIKIIRELNGVNQKEDMAVLIKRYQLAEREVEILKLLAKRYSNPQIAEALFISRNTVKYHIKNIFGKMGLKTRDEAVGLVEVEE